MNGWKAGGRAVGGKAGLNGSWKLLTLSERQLKHPDEYEGPEHFIAQDKSFGTPMVLAQKTETNSKVQHIIYTTNVFKV